jgi:hypothetical protein
MKKEITKEEFIEAFDIVNRYKQQLYDKIKECKEQTIVINKTMKYVDTGMLTATPNSFIEELDINTRVKRCLYMLWYKSGKNENDRKFHEVKLSELNGLSKSALKDCHGFGVKTIKEMELIFQQAQLTLKD